MTELIGKNYKNCQKTAGGHPIPEEIKLNLTGYKYEPLWFHTRGLMQTANGYGTRLKTEHMIRIDKRWYRVFCCQISNSGTIYIIKDGKHLCIDIELVIELYHSER